MFTVTQAAQNQIAEFFKGKEIKPVRIFLMQSCAGSQIGMTVDEKRDADMVFKVGGFEYLVEKNFLKKAQPIEVDFLGTGFQVTSSIELGGGCSGCGSTGTCCS